MTTPTIPPAVAEHLVDEVAQRQAQPIRRALAAADRIAADLVAAGYPPSSVTVSAHADVDHVMAQFDPKPLAADVAGAVGLGGTVVPTGAGNAYVAGDYHGVRLTLLGRAGGTHVVVDTDTGEHLTQPVPRGVADTIAAATVGRRVHVEAVTR